MNRLLRGYRVAQRVWWPWISAPCLLVALGLGVAKDTVVGSTIAVILPPALSVVGYRLWRRRSRGTG